MIDDVDLHPRRIALDVDAQVAALPGLQSAFATVQLAVMTDDGARATLVEVDAEHRRFHPLAVERGSAIELTAVDGTGAVSSGGLPVAWVPHAARVHVRATPGGHLEIVATDGPCIDEVVFAKIFARGASAADWPCGLVVADATRVEDLRALLDGPPAQELRALRVGGPVKK